MEPRHYSPIFGPAPDPHDYLWLSVSQPDGLYALPPDDPAQGNGEPISSAEALYLAVLIVAFGLLIAVLAFAAVVA
jgi:hypothetical protein